MAVVMTVDQMAVPVWAAWAGAALAVCGVAAVCWAVVELPARAWRAWRDRGTPPGLENTELLEPLPEARDWAEITGEQESVSEWTPQQRRRAENRRLMADPGSEGSYLPYPGQLDLAASLPCDDVPGPVRRTASPTPGLAGETTAGPGTFLVSDGPPDGWHPASRADLAELVADYERHEKPWQTEIRVAYSALDIDDPTIWGRMQVK